MSGSNEARVIISIGGLGLVLVTGFYVFAVERGWFAPGTAEQELARLPGMAAIRTVEPDAHAALARAMTDALAARRPPENAVWQANAALRDLLRKHGARADGEKIISLGKGFLTLLESDGAAPAALCRRLFDPALPETDLATPLARRLAIASLTAIGSGIARPEILPSSAQLAPALERLADRLGKVLSPEDIARLPRLTAAAPDTACRLLRTVLREVLALPEHQAIALLRHGLARQGE